MAQFAAWMESTWISKTLFGMSWLWPASESLHFVGLCLLIGGAGLLDLRLMGMFRGLAIRHVKALMPWAIGGFVINAVTGTLFLIMQPHLYVTSGVWWAKVAFLGVAGANALFFETRLAVPALAMDPDADTSTSMKVIVNIDPLASCSSRQRLSQRSIEIGPGTGGCERWAHWCLTSESASLTLMNACRVTPSLRAS